MARDENQTIYGNNFDGLYARVMKTPASVKAMKKPISFIKASLLSVQAAKIANMPVTTILAGLIVQFDKIKLLSLFGAATKKIQAATVDGDITTGVQFIGQTQGLINDQASVETIILRTVEQAKTLHSNLAAKV